MPPRVFSNHLNLITANSLPPGGPLLADLMLPVEPGVPDTVRLINPAPGLEQRQLDVTISENQMIIKPHDEGRLQVHTYHPTEAGTFKITSMFAASVGQIALAKCPPPDHHMWELISQEGEPALKHELGLQVLVNFVAQGIHKQLHDRSKPDEQ